MDDTATTVLIIDGRADDRKYWADWLNIASPENRILEAGTGASGLALCRLERVERVLTEVTLPDMSGFQLLLNLIPLARKPTIAVIMLTRLDLPPVANWQKTVAPMRIWLSLEPLPMTWTRPY